VRFVEVAVSYASHVDPAARLVDRMGTGALQVAIAQDRLVGLQEELRQGVTVLRPS
jgi:hypothetical protein